MATYFTIEPLDAQACADHGDRHQSLYAAMKTAERLAEAGERPCEVVAHGDISELGGRGRDGSRPLAGMSI